MRRFAGWVLAAVMTGGGVAHAGAKHEDWKAVKRLGAGVAVEVRSAGQAGVEECRVVRADDMALTCERAKGPDVDWGAGSGARFVFPRAAVEGVWVVEPAPERHIGRWIAIGVSVALVVAASAGSGALGGLIVGGGVAIAWTVWYQNPMPYWPPHPQRMRRRLVYRNATA